MESVSDRILVFGIESFTGQHIKALWQDRYDLWGCSFFESDDPKIIRCDITDKDSIKTALGKIRPQYILNLAGMSFVNSKDISFMYKVNTFAVEKMLEAVAETELTLKKLILPSSATVYGNQNCETLDETMCPKPINHYGISKLDMEFIACNYMDKINIIITRPFNYTGTGQQKHFVIPKIVEAFKSGSKTIELGNIDVFREFNDVDYICGLYEKLMLSNKNSTVVNMCSGRTHSLIDVVATMESISGYRIKVIQNPEFIRSNEMRSLRGSVDKLHNLIGSINVPELKTTLIKMYGEV